MFATYSFVSVVNGRFVCVLGCFSFEVNKADGDVKISLDVFVIETGVVVLVVSVVVVVRSPVFLIVISVVVVVGFVVLIVSGMYT